MKLKFDSNLDFQIKAINSITGVFKGQVKRPLNYTMQVVPNILTVSKEDILHNLQNIQKANNLPAQEKLEFPNGENSDHVPNFTVEMETGTGKTYIYLRTLLELNRQYGLTKFIIVVPSVAIKEGVLKTLEITKEHFKQVYDNLPYTYFTYSSGNLVRVRAFAQDTNLQIMVITRDAFNKDINIIHNVHDRMGDKPIELIKKTHPIVIMDEPQKIGGGASTWGISELNPLFILRYSATHREVYNLVYRLTPYDAYEFNLVKKIELLPITEEGDPSAKKIILDKIKSTSSGLKAKVKVFVKEKNGIKLKIISVKHGDDLAKNTENPYYDGFEVTEINKSNGYILFSNGIRIYEGKSSTQDDEIIRIMVKETIREHLEKKRRLNHKDIKVLSLFFINRVDDYLPKDGWLRKLFESEFEKLVDKEFPSFKKLEVKNIHKGYFSEMRQAQSIERDEKAYDLIMKDKERLLSLTEPVEFIFSHSALREGWDNPNVFNICTLSYSTSEIKKRQEIGRGLRLPVNQDGERIQSREINLLTVITNESYRDYIETLQTEFRDEVGEEAPPVENRRERTKIKIKEEVVKSALFQRLWRIISKRAKFAVDMDIERLCEQCSKDLNEVEIKSPKISIKKVGLTEIKAEGIGYEFLDERSQDEKLKRVLNVIQYIENETGLTRATILKILSETKSLESIFSNPQKYAEIAVALIRNNIRNFSVESITYFDLDESFNLDLFTREMQTYGKYVIKVNHSIYDGIIRDSDIEENFAKTIDKDTRIRLFIKLPELYYIETPAGNYTPDWTMIVERKQGPDKIEEIYFVVETKGTDNLYDLLPVEQVKIKSAKKRFELVKDARFVAPVKNFDSFVGRW
jgi:type III restriction enzyme